MTGRQFRSLLAQNIRIIENTAEDVMAAASLGDRRFVGCGFSILGDVIDDGIDFIRGFYEGRYRRRGMGATEERGRHWQEGAPIEILENMRLIQSYYTSIIKEIEATAAEMDEQQVRGFDRKRIQALREMALRVQTGKMSIMAKDPSFWTPAMEEEFREALEYRLSE